MPETIGIITGSGLAGKLDGRVAGDAHTSWGDASAPVARVAIGDGRAWVLPRHGEQQDIPAHNVNYRANVALLHAAGVQRLIGLNTVGVITGRCAPGGLAVPAQLIDYTWGREQTFFGGRKAGLRHVDFTVPFAAPLRADLLAAARRAGVPVSDGGVYAVTQGPRLETAAEIDRLERDGADYVGMTVMPEAALAAELGMEYACIALAVNAAAGRGNRPIHDDVDTNTASAGAAALAVLGAFFESAGKGAAR